jgi:protein-S-isoprenylcysteine O-methyltransferase Ste14
MRQVTSILLAIAMVAAGYFSVLCATPPNPSPERNDRHRSDRLRFMAGTFPAVARRITLGIIIYHALLTVVRHTPVDTMQVCPQSQNISPELFVWNRLSITSLLFIYIGAYIRLSAYGGLGKYFTFHLASPENLVTTGVYSWVQHPSYTGAGLVFIGTSALFMRWDATPACWIPDLALSHLQGWGLTTTVALILATFGGIGLRVLDEEDMLRQKFGQEWNNWHRSTKRFVPGLI